MLRPFHLAFPVHDLVETRTFYTEILGCKVGREKPESCVLNLHGHQIVAHLVSNMPDLVTNPVDGKQVPCMHFGIVLEWGQWHEMRERLEKLSLEFVIGPYLRYENQPGAQATMFIKDPSGNHLEFKSFQNDAMIFDASWGNMGQS